MRLGDEKSALLAELWDECERGFLVTINGLASALRLNRPLGSISLNSVDGTDFLAQVRTRIDDRLVVELSSGLLQQLHGLLAEHGEALAAAVGAPLQESAHPLPVPQSELLASIYFLALHFILQHELFHILCGHFGHYATAGESGVRSFSEATLAMSEAELAARTDVDTSVDSLLFSYYLELEADATAIESVLGTLVFERVEQFLAALDDGKQAPEPDRTILRMTGRDRIVAFRLVLAAIWVVIGLMEENRDIRLTRHSKTHPLPSARLFGALGTLMTEYADPEDVQLADSGELIVELSERTADALKEFMHEVLGPMAKGLADIPSPEVSFRLALPVGDSDSTPGVAALIADLGAMLDRRAPATTGAKQLLEVQKLRQQFLSRLKPFNYLYGDDAHDDGAV